jgi:hypothetical protein
MTDQELIDLFDEVYPINLKGHEDLINHIFQKYPYVSKVDIALIVRASLNVCRDQYLIGNNLKFPGITGGLHMLLIPVKRSYRTLQNLIPRLYCSVQTRIYALSLEILREMKENWKR